MRAAAYQAPRPGRVGGGGVAAAPAVAGDAPGTGRGPASRAAPHPGRWARTW